MQQSEILTDQRMLETHCHAWRAAGCFAFDTEFIRDDTYDAALCLIQVTTDGNVVLVDPTQDVDLNVFWDLVTDKSIVTVVHAGKEDFEVCLRSTGRVPRNVFDVQIAAGFVGYGYPLSLLRLVERMMHRRISKAQTLTDWLRRPLTPEQIRYAVEDVVYLPEIHTRLAQEIERAGRTAWAREEFKRFEEPEFYRPPPEERVLRLRGSKKLDGLGLLALERLVEWRDQWAQSRNRPTRALMRDDVLVEIARRRPQKERDLEVLRGFPQARNRKVVRELVKVIAEVSKTPKSEWPKPVIRHEDTPMTKALLDLLSAVIQATCCDDKLNWNLLGSTQRLRELLDYHEGRLEERPALLQGWREEFIGRRLLDLLEGRSRLHLVGWPEDPRLQLTARPTRKKT
ncbi:MAG: ribonuclease D [Phycisphaerae bacterium]|nr:ribonuclease D [Phycisphaerae bacterium]